MQELFENEEQLSLIQRKYHTSPGIITKLKFLKHKDKIKELYQEGISIKAIWVWMREDNNLLCGYGYFVKLFRKHIEPYSHSKDKKMTLNNKTEIQHQPASQFSCNMSYNITALNITLSSALEKKND